MVQREIGMISRLFFTKKENQNGILHEITPQQKGIFFIYGHCPVSYTHLDVYKRQRQYSVSLTVSSKRL